MDVADIKQHILDNNLITDVLSAIGCHHIKHHNGYYTCGNYDGNNVVAITLYENENLTAVNYTRELTKNKRTTDIFDLICYNKQCTFPESLKWACNETGLDYYQEPEEQPMSLQLLQLFRAMATGEEQEDDAPLKPINEQVLNYYIPCGNYLFENDGISLTTQRLFEIAFDPYSNSVVIPIRDELGTLIAVKARRLQYNIEDGLPKYFFLEPGPKSQVLYGLYQNIKMIQGSGVVYVGESEKFVQQLYDIGYYGVSTGGSKISRRQIEMLIRLGVKIVFCYDKDIKEEELKLIASEFIDGVPIYAMIDNDGVLGDKESPSDSSRNWVYLLKNNIYQIK